jgi:hypothetical protein
MVEFFFLDIFKSKVVIISNIPLQITQLSMVLLYHIDYVNGLYVSYKA